MTCTTTCNPVPTLPSTFKFWVPLATTWLMMATEGPTLTAVIARLPEPELNLAAFGVAFAIAPRTSPGRPLSRSSASSRL